MTALMLTVTSEDAAELLPLLRCRLGELLDEQVHPDLMTGRYPSADARLQRQSEALGRIIEQLEAVAP